MPAWASRVAKNTATIKNMTIKIRSVVVDMAIPLVVCASTSCTQRVSPTAWRCKVHAIGVWPKVTGVQRVTRTQRYDRRGQFLPQLVTAYRSTRVGMRRVAGPAGVERRGRRALFPARCRQRNQKRKWKARTSCQRHR